MAICQNYCLQIQTTSGRKKNVFADWAYKMGKIMDMDARSQLHPLEVQSTIVSSSIILQSLAVGTLKRIQQLKLKLYRETKKKSI